MLPPFRAHVDAWLILGSLAAAYLIACRRHAERTGVPASDHARRLFLTGVAVLWVGADWPIHDLAERYLYSVHMAQHLLFTLVAAPLLVAGTPAWLWPDLLRRRTVRRGWRSCCSTVSCCSPTGPLSSPCRSIPSSRTSCCTRSCWGRRS